jgi:hypothetical protein
MVEHRVLSLILSGYDDAWSRLDARLGGLTQDEYLWEPVGEMWSVRPTPDGCARTGPSPSPTRPG